MKSVLLSEGINRTKVSFSAHWIGKDLIVSLFNEEAHIGAVAVADYEHHESRASTSVITRLGHKEDSVARSAAYRLCKHLKAPVCVIAGIHVDSITPEEIVQITQNCDRLVDQFLRGS
jgi:hypothetical protein